MYNPTPSVAEVSTMMRRCTHPVIPEGADLGEVFDQHLTEPGKHHFIVERDGRFVGVLHVDTAETDQRETWPRPRVKYIMTPVEKVLAVYPYTALQDAMDLMERNNVDHVFVVAGHRLLGIIRYQDILEYHQIQDDLNKLM